MTPLFQPRQFRGPCATLVPERGPRTWSIVTGTARRSTTIIMLAATCVMIRYGGAMR
jgi:hypothetical protein